MIGPMSSGATTTVSKTPISSVDCEICTELGLVRSGLIIAARYCSTGIDVKHYDTWILRERSTGLWIT